MPYVGWVQGERWRNALNVTRELSLILRWLYLTKWSASKIRIYPYYKYVVLQPD